MFDASCETRALAACLILVLVAGCDGPVPAALRTAAACDAGGCVPSPVSTLAACPQDACLQATGTAPLASCAAAKHLDAATLPATGEIRLGQAFMSATVTGWQPGFCPRIPSVTWAMALAHASRITRIAGIPLDINEFLATAIKESTLGCAPKYWPCLPNKEASVQDGCFQMACSTAYAQMRQSYGGRFNAPPCAVLYGDRFESGALAKAFYDRFTWTVLRHRDPDLAAFFAQARDPQAISKVMAYAYNQGLYEPGLTTLFGAQRTACMQMTSMTSEARSTPNACFPDPVGHDYAWAVGRYTAALADPSGRVYDTPVSWSDVASYLDRIAALYPEIDTCGVRAVVEQRFNGIAGPGGTLSFQHQFGAVLDALLVALPTPEDPAAGLNASF